VTQTVTAEVKSDEGNYRVGQKVDSFQMFVSLVCDDIERCYVMFIFFIWSKTGVWQSPH